MHRRRLALMIPFALSLLVGLAQAAAAEPAQRTDAFLSELATIMPVDGYSPTLFRPENQPSRFEIAFFLFRFDQRLSKVAKAGGGDLTATLTRLWSAVNPAADATQGKIWGAEASITYRRLLLEYGREMNALGYRLRLDAYPQWSRGAAADAPGN